MSSDDNLLEALLAVVTDQAEDIVPDPIPEKKTSHSLKETDIFQLESNLKVPLKPSTSTSAVHGGDTDSSDDEGNRNYEDQKYNECGREIKHFLSSKEENSISSSYYGLPKQRTSTWKATPNNASQELSKPKPSVEKNKNLPKDVYMDPVFGMRIVNPKILLNMLSQKMEGRLAVQFRDLEKQMLLGTLKDRDWVICGVIVSKSPPRTSQKGSQYSIWTLSDLKDDIKTVSLFLFRGAHSDLWKTLVGSVVGILNPSPMDKREGAKDIATLSVDTAQRVMVFGDSKDFGTCKSLKKNGEKCTAIVNLSRCEFCIYHIKQEYQKCSKRSELQANFAGKGLVNLRNKVLGKNEVFYAGKSYTAIPAKKSKKLETRENNILQRLNVVSGSVNGGIHAGTMAKNKKIKNKKGAARHLDVNPAQRAKDLELLRKLGGSSASLESKIEFSGNRSNEVTTERSRAVALDVISKLKTKKESTAPPQSSQYNVKGDLFTNVENKSSFSGKFSENITLEESKNIALSVISKLKNNIPAASSTKPIEDDLGTISLEDFETELNYSDEEEVSTEKPKTEVKHMEEPKTHETTKLVSPANSIKQVPKELAKQPLRFSHTSPMALSKSPQTSSNLDKMCMGVPLLSGFGKSGFIDLSQPVTPRQVDRAKHNALKYIQRHGPIKKVDPNSTKGAGTTKKRPIDDHTSGVNTESPAKKSKLQESEFISDRFKKMMAMTSINTHLLEAHDNEEKEKYFNKLEAKERMEEKMVNTHKVKCKAVKCLKCKYVSFSASDLCKKEGHPLKVFDAMKRFYKCSNCQNRTVILEFVPTRPCGNCGSSQWEKAGMVKEKVAVVQHKLSVRGGEQKFINSAVCDASLDLLVPDD